MRLHGPAKTYLAVVASGEIQSDSAQLEAVEHLQRLYEALTALKPTSSISEAGWLGRLLGPADAT